MQSVARTEESAFRMQMSENTYPRNTFNEREDHRLRCRPRVAIAPLAASDSPKSACRRICRRRYRR